MIYPPLGALADSIGGLAGARILSLAFMLGATFLLWATTSRLFGKRAGFFAAALWALLGPTLKLGAFATFDPLYFSQESYFGNYRPTIRAVRRFAHRPILVSETAVGQVAGQAAKIPGLFSLIRAFRLLGFVWFDVAQHAGPYHQDWRLEGHPAAVAAFRHALRQYR